jgi:hypothetical protein
MFALNLEFLMSLAGLWIHADPYGSALFWEAESGSKSTREVKSWIRIRIKVKIQVLQMLKMEQWKV